MSNWMASVAATGAATASEVSSETNHALTIFIYPGKDFAECVSFPEHIHTLPYTHTWELSHT